MVYRECVDFSPHLLRIENHDLWFLVALSVSWCLATTTCATETTRWIKLLPVCGQSGKTVVFPQLLHTRYKIDQVLFRGLRGLTIVLSFEASAVRGSRFKEIPLLQVTKLCRASRAQYEGWGWERQGGRQDKPIAPTYCKHRAHGKYKHGIMSCRGILRVVPWRSAVLMLAHRYITWNGIRPRGVSGFSTRFFVPGFPR